MRKFLLTFVLIVFVILALSISILSTIGIETKQFNEIVTKKINENNSNLNLQLDTIKFKIDIKEISLFLETKNPKINYRNTTIPSENIKVYIDFFSVIKSDTNIKKIIVDIKELDLQRLKSLSNILKPSNFQSFLKNKVKKGKLDIEIEIYLNKQNLFNNFIARGKVSELKTTVFKDLTLENTKFSFFADKTDILLKSISGESGPIKVLEGDLKVKLAPEIILETNFKTKVNYNSSFKDYLTFEKDIKLYNSLSNFNANLINTFKINFDKTYKIKKYEYKNSGKIKKLGFIFSDPFSIPYLNTKINRLFFNDAELKVEINSNSKDISLKGNYSFNDKIFLPFNLKNKIKKKSAKFNIDLDYNEYINLEIINFNKPKNEIAKVFIDLEKENKKLYIKRLNIQHKDNQISLEKIKFNDGVFSSLKKVYVKTYKDSKENNNFLIDFGDIIKINGSIFDARYLPKIVSRQSDQNYFKYLNKEVDINIENIIAPLSEKIKDFKLIGTIKNGKFMKISSKGDFGANNFLDIKMKNDRRGKKFLEIYSDLTKPLLTEYDFFKGLTGGNLLYTSLISENSSTSKLQIENFKVVNAPGMVKLLSLADLGGLADLAEGEGLSFDLLEIKMEKTKEILKIDEILAIGPSISVLMEGYQTKNLTSLRGTLVPAKTLNNIISKIPVLGDIIIPKEAGEGLFGISFKLKGPPGKIKTTINPIRTLTPRFIQKIIDKNKISN